MPIIRDYIDPRDLPYTADVVVWKEGDYAVAKIRGKRGEESEKDLGKLLNEKIFPQLPNTDRKRYIKIIGEYILNSTIFLKNNLIIDLSNSYIKSYIAPALANSSFNYLWENRSGISNVEIIGGIIDFNNIKSNYPGICIWGYDLDENKYSNNITIKNLKIINLKRDQSEWGGIALSIHSVKNVELSNIETGFNTFGIDISPGAYGNNITINRIYSHDNELDGMSPGYGYNIICRNCIFYNNGRHGIAIDSAQDIVLLNIYSLNNDSNGIAVFTSINISPSNVKIISSYSHNNGENGIYIAGANNIYLSYVSAISNKMNGIYVSSVSGYKYINYCDLIENYRYGLYLYDSHNSNISYCYFYDNSREGDGSYSHLYIDDYCNMLDISNNRFYTSSVGKVKCGIEVNTNASTVSGRVYKNYYYNITPIIDDNNKLIVDNKIYNCSSLPNAISDGDTVICTDGTYYYIVKYVAGAWRKAQLS